MKGYLSSGEFAEHIGVHPNTVRNWDRTGYLKPALIVCNRRYYTPDQVELVMMGDVSEHARDGKE